MASPVEQTRNIQVIEHPILINFNEQFGAKADLSRYDNVSSSRRATSTEAIYVNQLQMGSYIPTRTALLLKNNLHDVPFIIHTTRSILYQLKQNGKIGETCFHFLHNRLNEKDFSSVFQYLYILMLYTKIAETHDIQTRDNAFRFESSANYSDKLAKSPAHIVAKEEQSLQDQTRKLFLRQYLTELAGRSNCPREAQQQIFSVVNSLESADFNPFRSHFLTLLEKLKKTPELEKICWEETESILKPFTGKEFFSQVYLHLKTESYYKDCLSRVTTLRQSLERTNGPDLLTQSEKCKRAYNGCIYLLVDGKNMPPLAAIRFASITGKMRAEWQAINNAFNRAQAQFVHRLCACQAQTPPSQNEMAEWPFNSHPLIPVEPARPMTPQLLAENRIPQAEFQENQKRTVAIIGCKWGGGHMEVSRGAANKLASLGYHPVTIDLPEILIDEDPIRSSFITRWLGKDWSIATIFEELLKNKAFASINFLRWIKSKLFPSFGYTDRELKSVLQHLLKVNPDHVITTYSAHNEAIIKACEILGIPCMHINTDIDTSIETRDTPPSFKNFKVAVPFNTPECLEPISQKTTADQRFVSGPPVRHEFTQPRTEADIRHLKQIWGIDQNKKVVIISNGKAGAHSSYPEILAQKYAHMKPEEIPIHLVVICGKNNLPFKNYLEQNVLPKTNLPIRLELHTDKMEQLMSMAAHGGVLIGKSGGGTIFESFSRGTRLLIDNVRPSLFSQGIRHFFVTLIEMCLRQFGFSRQLLWEKINSDFAKKSGLAESFQDEKEFLPKLEQMLNNDGQPVRLTNEVKNVELEIPKVLREQIVVSEVGLAARNARRIRQNL